MNFQPVTRVAVVLPILMLAVLLAAATPGSAEDVSRKGLSGAAANPEILGMQAKGYSLKTIAVTPNGNSAKYDLTFVQEQRTISAHLRATPATTAQALQKAKTRGNVYITQLKGYVLNNKIYFVYVAHIVGPPGPPMNYRAFIDVPTPQFNQLVSSEGQKGGKLADYSTYTASNGKTYHTALFYPR